MYYGLYGIYKGKQHKISIDTTGKVFLLPDSSEGDPKDIINAQVVDRADISEVYRLRLYAEYKGYKADIAREVGDEYELWITDYETAERLGFNRCDKYGYNLMVKKIDVKVIAEKAPFKV